MALLFLDRSAGCPEEKVSMLFFPHGIFDGSVVSPEKTAREFFEAQQVADNCTQYQFNKESFNHSRLETESHVKVEYVEQEATLRFGPGAIDFDSTSSNFFFIPYMRGLQEVTMPTDGWPEWTSTYTELVFVVFSFQYARDRNAHWNPAVGSTATDAGYSIIRSQIKLFIDGVSLPGAGVAPTQFYGLSRGAGLGAQSAFTSIHAMTVLPAGSHRVSVRAGQKSCVSWEQPWEAQAQSTGAKDQHMAEPTHNLTGDPPTSGVLIGNRSILVLRFARGGELGG